MLNKIQVEEVIQNQEVQKKKSTGSSRYSEKRYADYVKAIANDTEFHTERYVSRDGKMVNEEVYPSKRLRKFLKAILEQIGVDKSESTLIEDPNFVIKNVDGLIDFIKELNYAYLVNGNELKLPDREDFQGSIYIADYDEKKETKRSINPKTGEVGEPYLKITKAHKRLKVKSTPPSWLIEKDK